MAAAKSPNKPSPLTRGDIAGAVAAKQGVPQTQGDAMTKEYEAAVIRALASGQEVRLAGFGSFKIAHRAARMARNPQTGQQQPVAAKTVVRFAPGKAFKDAVNGTKADAKPKAKATATKTAAPKAAAATKAPSKAAAAKGGKKGK